MACEFHGGLENCQRLRCPCVPDCPGVLEYTGLNTRLTLAFLECNVCRCAHVSDVVRSVPQIHAPISDEEKAERLRQLNGEDPNVDYSD